MGCSRDAICCLHWADLISRCVNGASIVLVRARRRHHLITSCCVICLVLLLVQVGVGLCHFIGLFVIGTVGFGCVVVVMLVLIVTRLVGFKRKGTTFLFIEKKREKFTYYKSE